MKKRSKIIIIVGVLILVVVIVLLNLFRSGEKVYTVEADKVKKGDLASVVSGSGKVQAKKDVKIGATVPGLIISLPVKDGDIIKKGQLLVQIDPSEYKSAVAQATAQLNSAEANFEQAKLLHERQQKLFEKSLTSKEQYDASLTQYDVAKAQYDQSQASLRQAEDLLAKTTITAPMDGKITELLKKEGEMVAGATYNPTEIMTISDLSAFEVEVEVDETDIAETKLVQEAKIKIDAFPDTSFKGEVSEIGNTAKVTGYGTQDQVVNFLVKVLILDEVKGIKPGMSASVDITTASHKDVLNIPIAAVVMREEKKDSLSTKSKKDKSEALASSVKEEKDKKKKKEIEGVFLVEKGRAKFVPVKSGIADQQNMEIVSGLKENDQIITGSYKILRTLKDGDKVKIEKKIEKKEGS
ncbi:MAG: efflux RND transporter periplasmic adaptor subunit [candidate division Zixibacteria bacterium]|jgi:HlyD family secretion protein|nr:efflux RND transporter periplasmic adaptor subunit [candidate division Zixibacteria bacterium]